MFFDKLFSKLLLLCIPLYFIQGWLFESGGTISQLLIGIWLLVDFYYLIVFFRDERKTSVGKTIIVFWIIGLLYWIISPKIVNGLFDRSFNTFGDFKNMTVVFLSYFPFYRFSLKSIVAEKWIRYFSILLLIAAIIAFFYKQSNLLYENDRLVTNNTAYYFVVILPLLGAFFGKKSFIVVLAIMIYFLLICAKRGALICASISIIVFLLLWFKNAPNSRKVSRFFLITFFVLIIGVFVYKFYSSSELLQTRLIETQEGESSGRDYIFANIWYIHTNSSILNRLFGYGMSQTVTLIGGYAHNDWLQLLLDQGLFGVLLYAVFYIAAFKYYFKNRLRMNIQYRYMYISALLCFLTRTLFSMGYLAPESALFVVGLALGQGEYALWEKQNKTT